MSDTPIEIQSAFNDHMFMAHDRLGLDVHETSIAVKHYDGFYNVRFRASFEGREGLTAAAREFADKFTPPLNVNFV